MDKKKIVIALVAMLLLGGGGGGAFLFLGDVDLGARFSAPDPAFVELPTLSRPVFRDNELQSYVHMAVTLELFDKDDKIMVERLIPLLRDAFLRSMSRAPERAEDDLNKVKASLLEIANQLAGEGVVRGVLVIRTIKGPA